MSCLCAKSDGDGDWAKALAGLPIATLRRASTATYYWSPNTTASPSSVTARSFGLSFRRRWRELEGQAEPTMVAVGQGSPVPPELFSCYLEATAGRAAQFDAASYSSGTLSSGISSWKGATNRSRSSSSSRGSLRRPRSPSIEGAARSASRRRSPSAGGSAPSKPPRRARHRSVDASALVPRGGAMTLPSAASSPAPSAAGTPSRASRARGRQMGEGVARAHSMGRLSLPRHDQPRPPVRRRKGLVGAKKV